MAHEYSHGHGHARVNSPAGNIIWIRVAVSAALIVCGHFAGAYFSGLGFALQLAGWAVAGYDVVLRTRFRFDENLLMTAATIGALCIGEAAEAGIVMALYQIGEALQESAVARSRRSVTELCAITPDTANLITGDGSVISKNAEEVAVGSRLLVRPGEMIPLDGIVKKGETSVNTASLTGESQPRGIGQGDAVFAGTINISGVIEIETTLAAQETVAARTLRLIEQAESGKAKIERFITRFAKIYTPIVMLLALMVAVIPPLAFDGEWGTWVYRALVLLVASCPCALVVSIPLCYFAGIGGAAKAGILVKSGTAMDSLAGIALAVFDKTGTLTQDSFGISQTVCADGADEATLNRCAAIAEYHSSHPLGVSLRTHCGDVGAEPEKYMETPGLGVTASFAGQIIHAGSHEYLTRLGVKDLPELPGTVVYISLDSRLIGYFRFAAPLREQARETVQALRKWGIKTAMLTGDKEEPAKEAAETLGIDHVSSGLLPSGKLSELEGLMGSCTGATAYIGDGMNDAASLIKADVGIAIGGAGNDAAMEAADIVLMGRELFKLPQAVEKARRTRALARGNIIFTTSCKVAVLALAAIGIAPLWLAVAADLGVSLIAVLNAMRARG
ncbi:MAG: cadmium-translocating P-type ATPase [Oscillospiraceae bacterium]|nr:cadmium-translocating P-type ATPase [Oscillospiraceae bacterium]